MSTELRLEKKRMKAALPGEESAASDLLGERSELCEKLYGACGEIPYRYEFGAKAVST